MSALAPTLQAFFTERLINQRHASAHTIAAYRDTWRLLLAFAASRSGIPPSQLDVEDLNAELVGAFLDHLETARGNNARTRNVRLAGIRSLFRFAALRHPEHANTIAQVLFIPPKRTDRALVTYLSEPEVEALLAVPDQGNRTGRRDLALLLVAIQCGLRISELIALSRGDIHLGTGAHVTCTGKGRKQRTTPLTTNTVLTLRSWLNETKGQPADPLFPSRDGRRLSRDAIERRLAQYIATARGTCPTLCSKRVTVHTLRHTTAMRLLHAGVDTTVIALWLGHENVETTQIYLHADLELKERALARTTPTGTRPGRYKPPEEILAWLQAL